MKVLHLEKIFEFKFILEICGTNREDYRTFFDPGIRGKAICATSLAKSEDILIQIASDLLFIFTFSITIESLYFSTISSIASYFFFRGLSLGSDILVPGIKCLL